MTEINDKSNIIRFKKYRRAAKYYEKPVAIVLHHTVSGSIGGTERYLADKTVYGYHFMIDKSGNICQYVDPGKYSCNHAKGANSYSIGVSFVCGGQFGPVNKEQIESYVFLAKSLSKRYPSILYQTGHKDVSPGRKIDPTWSGEPRNSVNWSIHKKQMEKLADITGIEYRGH